MSMSIGRDYSIEPTILVIYSLTETPSLLAIEKSFSFISGGTDNPIVTLLDFPIDFLPEPSLLPPHVDLFSSDIIFNFAILKPERLPEISLRCHLVRNLE